MRKGNGFTLIELLIVLAILGILVGIVAMSVGDLETAGETWDSLKAVAYPGHC